MSDIAFLAGFSLFAGVEVRTPYTPRAEKPAETVPAPCSRGAHFVRPLHAGRAGRGRNHALRPDQPPVGTLHHVPDRLRTLPRRMAHQRHEPARGVRHDGRRAVVDLRAPAAACSGRPTKGGCRTICRKTNRNGVQINILIIQGCIVTVLSSLYIFMKDVSVAFFLLSALTSDCTLMIMYMMMYAAIRLRYTQPGLPGATTAFREAMPACGPSAASASSPCSSRSPSPSSAVADLPVGGPPYIRRARRLRHGAVPRRPHRHQHRDGPPARQRPPYLKSEMRAGPFGLARIAFRPLPQRFRIAPPAVTRSVTSRSRSSSSSTSYQSPSGVSRKSARRSRTPRNPNGGSHRSRPRAARGRAPPTRSSPTRPHR